MGNKENVYYDINGNPIDVSKLNGYVPEGEHGDISSEASISFDQSFFDSQTSADPYVINKGHPSNFVYELDYKNFYNEFLAIDADISKLNLTPEEKNNLENLRSAVWGQQLNYNPNVPNSAAVIFDNMEHISVFNEFGKYFTDKYNIFFDKARFYHIIIDNAVTTQNRLSGNNEELEKSQSKEQVETPSTNPTETAPEAPEPKSIPDVASTIFQINSKAYKQNQKKLQEKYNSNSSLEISDPSPVMKYHKKVSLNVAPISKLNVLSGIGNTEWRNRLKYVLGKESTFLYELFHNEGGIVFPYTPKVDFEHKVNYERTEIMHSNLAVSHYKNTPPPTITLQADFTADGEYNARYMYGVIHFLRAISKCEFGESLFSGDERKDYAGIPPPVLYLNGYGNYMINVPVVVTSFGINFEKNKHYVHLKPENVWLPTDITISINLEIQFNLDKYKKQFDLEKYKENTLGENNIVSFNNIFYLMTEGEYINKDANGNEIDRKKGKKLSEYNIESNVRLNGSGWTW